MVAKSNVQRQMDYFTRLHEKGLCITCRKPVEQGASEERPWRHPGCCWGVKKGANNG